MPAREQPVTVTFADADPAGVIFYPRAIALAHDVVEDMIRASTLGWDAWFASPVHASPLRRAEGDFLLPMRPGKTFTARACVSELGTTSVTFRVEFIDQDGRAAARVTTVHVLIEKATGRPVPLTPAIRTAFAELR